MPRTSNDAELSVSVTHSLGEVDADVVDAHRLEPLPLEAGSRTEVDHGAPVLVAEQCHERVAELDPAISRSVSDAAGRFLLVVVAEIGVAAAHDGCPTTHSLRPCPD